jgi:NAD(P)H-dependent flavin oxidoreductase YrpB (nitropropane dioxygenase family)
VSISYVYVPLAGDTFFVQSRYGASGVWVGTRFVASVEAGAPPRHKELVVSAGHDDIIRTVIYTGRPLNVRKTPYVADWETQRQQEIAELVARGKVPHDAELEKHPEKSLEGRMCKECLRDLI